MIKYSTYKLLYKRFTMKDQKSNYDILLDLWKRSSETGENFVCDPYLNMI